MTQPKESRRPSHAPISLAWQGITPPDLFGLVVVMFLWALCFPLISLGLMSSPPLTFATLRSLVAGAGLLLPAYALRLGGTVLILASMLWVSLGRSSSVVEQNRVHE